MDGWSTTSFKVSSANTHARSGKMIDVEHNFDSIDGIPGFEAVSRNKWDLYVNSLGPAAVKYNRVDSFDLTLFWKSKAENLPELYKLASCYPTTTIGSYDVGRSFSAYSAILDENADPSMKAPSRLSIS